MKTLIKIYESIKQKKIAYHVSDSDVRDSIKKFGLDPKKSKDDTTSENNIFLFLKLSEAKSYVLGYKNFLKYQEEEERNFDIWEIDVTDLNLKKDLGLNDGNDQNNSAYFTRAPISNKRIKLKISAI